LAVIQVGAGNNFGHPDLTTLARLIALYHDACYNQIDYDLPLALAKSSIFGTNFIGRGGRVAKKKCDKNCPYRLRKIRCPFRAKEAKKDE
jgi:hypothetical protein